MKASVEPRIRAMNLEDLEMVLGWAAAEGWNPGLADAAAFFAADPGGYFLAELEGRPVGAISAVVYDQRFAFAGLYMVRSELRGQGLGRLLAQHAAPRLGGRVIGLDGVAAQQENYRRMGFVMAFNSLRLEGLGGGADPGGLTELDAIPFAQVEAYDRACFPAPRPEFLRRWLAYPGGTALGVLRGGELAGYGVLRPCQTGGKIGPLFADDAATAERLYQGLCAQAPVGSPVFLDAPQNNPQAVELARRHGLRPVFECARMYMNGSPAWEASRVYGITTFELG